MIELTTTSETLKAEITNLFAVYRKEIENGGSIPGHFLCLTADGEVNLVRHGFSDTDTKNKYMSIFKAYSAYRRFVKVITLTECWMRTVDKKQWEEGYVTEPSKSELRKEALLICGETLDKNILAYSQIERHFDETISTMDLDWQEGSSNENQRMRGLVISEEIREKLNVGDTEDKLIFDMFEVVFLKKGIEVMN